MQHKIEIARGLSSPTNKPVAFGVGSSEPGLFDGASRNGAGRDDAGKNDVLALSRVQLDDQLAVDSLPERNPHRHHPSDVQSSHGLFGTFEREITIA